MPYVIILLILLTAYPFVFCQFLPIPSINLLGAASFLLLLFIHIYKRKFVTLPVAFNCIFFVQLFCWLFYSIYHSDSSYITRLVFMLVAYLALSYAYNHKKGLLFVVKIFNWIILGMAIGGTISFFLCALGLLTPLFEFSNVDGRTAYFFGLTCTNTYIFNIIRYSGFFDEPGAMAYWGVFALLFNRLFVKNARYEKVLMVCLAFTFSLAYFIQLCCFVLFSKKKLKGIMLLLCGILAIYVLIYSSQGTDFDVYRFTIGRLEVNERTGDMAGDNRSVMATKAKESFFSAPIMGIGARNAEVEYMADNPYEILAKDGIVGEIVTYLPLVLIALWGIKKRNYDFVCAAFILFVGYQQRPFHVGFIHPIILYLLTILTLEYKNDIDYEADKNISCNSCV